MTASRRPMRRTRGRSTKLGRHTRAYMQNDVNLTSPPLAARCTGTDANGAAFTSHFLNAPFRIDDYIAPSDTTCPAPGMSAPNGVPKGSGLPGGCTRDLVHRFYQEQYQLNGGRQNRYVTGSDAVGLAMGYYDTRQLPIYRYSARAWAPEVRDLRPLLPGGVRRLVSQSSVADRRREPGVQERAQRWFGGRPALAGRRERHADQLPALQGDRHGEGLGADRAVRVAASGRAGVWRFRGQHDPAVLPAVCAGDGRGATAPPQEHPTIGDRLSANGVDWAWYSGGWSNANGDVGGPGWTNGSTPGTCTDPQTATGAAWPNCPNKLFQYHHQSFNYFKAYAPGTQARRRASPR